MSAKDTSAAGKHRPKLLLIKHVLPFPPDRGTRVVSFGLIRALQEDFEVTVLARLLSKEESDHARSLARWCSRVVTVLAPNKRSTFHRLFFKLFYYLKSTFFRRSMKSLYDCPGAFVRAAKTLSKENFDLVVLEYWQLLKIASLFPSEKVVLLTHDIDMLINRQISLLERDLVRKVGAIRRWLLEQKEEIKAYRTVENILTLTERDKAAVEHFSGKGRKVEVLPFGIDVDSYSPPGEGRNPREILFVGAMEAPFNQDAIGFFAKRIYPLLDSPSQVKVTIVGGALPKELAYFSQNKGVEVIGRVTDLRPYLHRATCLIVPLRFGGGLRIRILEAMAAELPVVCTKVAILGMPYEAERDYLLAESPEEFNEQIGRLFNNEELRSRLSERAKERTKEVYGSGTQREKTVALFRELMHSA